MALGLISDVGYQIPLCQEFGLHPISHPFVLILLRPSQKHMFSMWGLSQKHNGFWIYLGYGSLGPAPLWVMTWQGDSSEICSQNDYLVHMPSMWPTRLSQLKPSHVFRVTRWWWATSIMTEGYRAIFIMTVQILTQHRDVKPNPYFSSIWEEIGYSL